jgi:hypothetical protein
MLTHCGGLCVPDFPVYNIKNVPQKDRTLAVFSSIRWVVQNYSSSESKGTGHRNNCPYAMVYIKLLPIAGTIAGLTKGANNRSFYERQKILVRRERVAGVDPLRFR